MRKRYIIHFSLLTFFCFFVGCTPRTTYYQSGTLESARIAYSMPEMFSSESWEVMKQKSEKSKKETENMERYKTILEQDFQFSPPVKILLIIPKPPQQFSWWHTYGYPIYMDSLNAMLYASLADKFKSSEYVSNIDLASSIFSYGTLNNLRELAAYYRADECLLVSYDLYVMQPTSCLGFWPGARLQGVLSSEAMLIDTRTGFFLLGRKYSFSQESTSSRGFFSSKELEIMHFITDEWTDKIVGDLLEFYKSEVK